MVEEDKGTSSWYKVPMWFGGPSEWRSFKQEMQEMEWWIASLDLKVVKSTSLQLDGPADKQVCSSSM